MVRARNGQILQFETKSIAAFNSQDAIITSLQAEVQEKSLLLSNSGAQQRKKVGALNSIRSSGLTFPVKKILEEAVRFKQKMMRIAKPNLISIGPQHDLSIVIITKNSQRFFEHIIDAYRAIDIEPVIFLDGNSEVGMEELLIRKRAKYYKVFPSAPRVEAFIEIIPDYIQSKWILRIDDDEFPSRKLITWLKSNLAKLSSDAIGIPRRWVRIGSNGRCEYSQHKLLKWNSEQMDPQFRLYQPKNVEYTTQIHTPGFVPKHIDQSVPHQAYLAHFDWIVRSMKEREQKIIRYDEQTKGAGSNFLDLYVWERAGAGAHSFEEIETREFDQLAAAIRHD